MVDEKTLMAIPRVCNANEYYMNQKKLHAKNERLYVATKKDTILKQVCHIAIQERKGKVVQFMFISICLKAHLDD
jgi:hypothetical protein